MTNLEEKIKSFLSGESVKEKHSITPYLVEQFTSLLSDFGEFLGYEDNVTEELKDREEYPPETSLYFDTDLRLAMENLQYAIESFDSEKLSRNLAYSCDRKFAIPRLLAKGKSLVNLSQNVLNACVAISESEVLINEEMPPLSNEELLKRMKDDLNH